MKEKKIQKKSNIFILLFFFNQNFCIYNIYINIYIFRTFFLKSKLEKSLNLFVLGFFVQKTHHTF